MRRIASLATVLVMALVAAACITKVAPRATSTSTSATCSPVGPGADLTNCDLGNRNLAGVDLQGAYVKDTNRGYSNLAGANLRNVRFDGTFYTGADFTGATMTGAKFKTFLKAGTTNISGPLGMGANFTHENLSGSAIGGNLSFANFTNANLSRGVSLGNAILNYANFTGAAWLGRIEARRSRSHRHLVVTAQCFGRLKKKANSSLEASIEVVSCPNCFSMDGTGFPGHPCPPPSMM